MGEDKLLKAINAISLIKSRGWVGAYNRPRIITYLPENETLFSNKKYKGHYFLFRNNSINHYIPDWKSCFHFTILYDQFKQYLDTVENYSSGVSL
jgi:hypothetical protein